MESIKKFIITQLEKIMLKIMFEGKDNAIVADECINIGANLLQLKDSYFKNHSRKFQNYCRNTFGLTERQVRGFILLYEQEVPEIMRGSTI